MSCKKGVGSYRILWTYDGLDGKARSSSHTARLRQVSLFVQHFRRFTKLLHDSFRSSERGSDFTSRLISTSVADFFHLVDYEFQLFIGVVEMWRDAHARARAIINDELAAN